MFLNFKKKNTACCSPIRSCFTCVPIATILQAVAASVPAGRCFNLFPAPISFFFFFLLKARCGALSLIGHQGRMAIFTVSTVAQDADPPVAARLRSVLPSVLHTWPFNSPPHFFKTCTTFKISSRFIFLLCQQHDERIRVCRCTVCVLRVCVRACIYLEIPQALSAC